MPQNLKALQIKLLKGDEPLKGLGRRFPKTLIEFWRWSCSDLVSNATRGRLAEFIVAMALDCNLSGVRDEWQAWDLTTRKGLKIEVKSAAYLQSWNQRELSKISFSVKKSLAWDRESNRQSKKAQRQGDAYVFALLKHKHKATVNPLNLDQWVFYVLPTKVLDARERSQHSITLKSLEALTTAVGFGELASGVGAIRG